MKYIKIKLGRWLREYNKAHCKRMEQLFGIHKIAQNKPKKKRGK